jgi:hypothetical protein
MEHTILRIGRRENKTTVLLSLQSLHEHVIELIFVESLNMPFQRYAYKLASGAHPSLGE